MAVHRLALSLTPWPINLPHCVMMCICRREDVTDRIPTGGQRLSAVRPFHVNVPEAELTELRRRINAAKWSERETVTAASRGLHIAAVEFFTREEGMRHA
jgi:hypothetical protein